MIVINIASFKNTVLKFRKKNNKYSVYIYLFFFQTKKLSVTATAAKATADKGKPKQASLMSFFSKK